MQAPALQLKTAELPVHLRKEQILWTPFVSVILAEIELILATFNEQLTSNSVFGAGLSVSTAMAIIATGQPLSPFLHIEES